MENVQTGHTSHLPPAADPLVRLSEKALEKLLEFRKSTPGAGDKHFRVFVEGGGCSGYQYGYTFDTPRDGDEIIDTGSIWVLLDPASLQYLKGATVDYVESFGGGGFSVKNPNASSSCGCGTSFSV